MKVVVDVIEATNLLPKDGHGSSNPYVKIRFNDQTKRTRTEPATLSPTWNETVFFSLPDPSLLPGLKITVSIFHESDGSDRAAFLGQVVISGSSVGPANSASVQRFPLEKRFFFARVSGELALRLCYLNEEDEVRVNESPKRESEAMKKQHQEHIRPDKKQGPERHVFHAVSSGGGGGGGDKKKPNPPAAKPAQPNFDLIPTQPPLPGLSRGRISNKFSATYDLVEPMNFLFMYIVKARDLPTKDITGFLDPYVEVRIGNYKGVTKFLEKNSNPVWRQVFAFSQLDLQADAIEVVVKNRNVIKDDYVGRVLINMTDVPQRIIPDGPMAPQWYRLRHKDGHYLTHGEIMFATWWGNQADESFPDAWHSDAHDLSPNGTANTRSKVYFSPKMAYLRVSVLEAQDLVPVDNSRPLNAIIRVKLGHQTKRTRAGTPSGTLNPSWNEDLLLVACQPFNEPLVITVEDGSEELGRLILPLSGVPRNDQGKKIPPKWYNLASPHADVEESKKKETFSSKLHLKMTLDTGYHVIDEPIQHSSNFQPASKKIQKSPVGLLEVGFLSARNLVGAKAPYCVAKYGPKWIRTRTLLNTTSPRWNEQYSWDVFDPCTVITIAVFDNSHIDTTKDSTDKKIGKVRIRISTLETDKIYTHFYPLLALQPSGVKKTGELHLAIRFTCTAWVNMIIQYSRPRLPKMHYSQPISMVLQDQLRGQAVVLSVSRLSRAEPPLSKEVIDYFLGLESNMWSLRRSKANFYRFTALISCLNSITKWINKILNWKNPITTILVHVLFVTLVLFPELILPTIFLSLAFIGLSNYRFRPMHPPHINVRLSQADVANSDELDEEFDTFPTSKGMDIVRMRYDRLRTIVGKVQTVAGDLATQGERMRALLSWRDPRATWIVVIMALFLAVVLYVVPITWVMILLGFYLLRHPKFRSKSPSIPANFYKRLPAHSDTLL